MNRYELIQAVVDEYMDNLLDNPEVVRTALEVYFEQFNNDMITQTLNGFKGV